MPTPPRDQFLDLPEGDPLSTEHLDEKVQQAEQQEQSLKRQLEAIERQKREFSELSRRQEAMIGSRNELAEKLDRAIKVIERETMEAGKRLEMLQAVDTSFRDHLENIGSINPKHWGETEIPAELARAAAAVDDARGEYNRSFPKISVIPEQAAGASAGDSGYAHDSSGGDDKDFIGWLKIGFAFSLPLMVLLLIVLVFIASRLPK